MLLAGTTPREDAAPAIFASHAGRFATPFRWSFGFSRFPPSLDGGKWESLSFVGETLLFVDRAS